MSSGTNPQASSSRPTRSTKTVTPRELKILQQKQEEEKKKKAARDQKKKVDRSARRAAGEIASSDSDVSDLSELQSQTSHNSSTRQESVETEFISTPRPSPEKDGELNSPDFTDDTVIEKEEPTTPTQDPFILADIFNLGFSQQLESQLHSQSQNTAMAGDDEVDPLAAEKEQLKNDREALTIAIGRVKDVLDSHTQAYPLSQASVTVNTNKLKRFTEKVEDIERRTYNLFSAANRQQPINDLHNIIDLIDEAMVRATELTQAPSSSRMMDHRHNHSNHHIKLPTIELPTFSGNYPEWKSFHDKFTALIHNNTNLTDSQRLQYLMSALRGDAIKAVESYEITDDNYQIVFDIIQKRYDHEREITNARIKQLNDLPFLTHQSAKGLQDMVDTVNATIRALEKISPSHMQNEDGNDVTHPQTHRDLLIINMILIRLDYTTRRDFESSFSHSKNPQLDYVIDFLDQRARALSVSQNLKSSSYKSNQSQSSQSQSNQPQPQPNSQKFSNQNSNTNQQQPQTGNRNNEVKKPRKPLPPCFICSGDHKIYSCETFASLNVNQRRLKISKANRCENCLGSHEGQCKSAYNCKTCNKRHHVLLHSDQEKSPPSANHSTDLLGAKTILATAKIQVQNNLGNQFSARALLDNGAQISLISEKCVKAFNLPKETCTTAINGPGGNIAGFSKGKTRFIIKSKLNPTWSCQVEALILPQVSSTLPQTQFDTSNWNHIHMIKLADPQFNTPANVDLLLGADVCTQVFTENQKHDAHGLPTALGTVFGYVLMGKDDTENSTQVSVNNSTLSSLNFDLTNYWNVEEIQTPKPLSEEEQRCEDIFVQTHKRTENGQYETRLPFRDEIPSLGNSKRQAYCRQHHLEKRLAANPIRRQQYNEFMDEFLALGHMEKIPPEEINTQDNQSYYMPHHFVIKESSTTTKLRAVFDASAKTTNGKSLNDNLLIGPTIQEDLISILIRQRFKKVALLADIAKMYRQIIVFKPHTDFQRIVWRKSTDEPMEEYRILTVTYGTGSAPFEATRVIRQMSYDYETEFPVAALVLRNDFYVDDCWSGTHDDDSGIQLQQQLRQLLSNGRFEIRKWSSNSQKVLESIPEHLRETELPLRIDLTESVKALGIVWNPASDNYSFKVNPQEENSINSHTTKRIMASMIARVFDPFGWLSPVTIRAKLLLQRLWSPNSFDWDEKIPKDLQNQWKLYISSLPEIEKIEIPRYLQYTPENSSWELHAFCDSSEKAYGAVVYLRGQLSDNSLVSNIIIAKTKVAPIKYVSLPILELYGALMLVNLVESVQKAATINFKDVHYWTDSQIVLCWISQPSNVWEDRKVANRVSKIQEKSKIHQWHHVPSKENPADCASRGISPNELIHHDLWWHGPPWLLEDSLPIQSSSNENLDPALLKKKKYSPIVHLTTKSSSLTQSKEIFLNKLCKYSSWTKLVRIVSYMLRFVHKKILKTNNSYDSEISIEERMEAENFIFRILQRHSFQAEILAIQNNSLLKNNFLAPLSPFMENGLLRVGGRLRHAEVPNDRKHPVLLPRNHPLTRRYIQYIHTYLLHGGTQAILAQLNGKVWISNPRTTIRKIVNQCHICYRMNSTSAQQMMADLPAKRVKPSQPFQFTGVDYAGPYKLKTFVGKRATTFKSYIALFTCFSTRAIHLELSSDLSTRTCMMAIKRFIGRRGKPQHIFSDNGTNFEGAKNEINETQEISVTNEMNADIKKELSKEGIKWSFNPPSAPHHGGVWEIGVKLIKHHLKRILTSEHFTYEEFNTLLIQVEAIVNSRPLTQLSNDPEDLEPLTPAHFLIGKPLVSLPEPNLDGLELRRLSNPQLIERKRQDFWSRWSQEYLTRLQNRPKWMSPSPDFKVGDLCIIREDYLPPMKWSLGRITATHPGADGLVRVVTLRTKGKVYKRPISKICHLPANEDMDLLISSQLERSRGGEMLDQHIG